MKMTFRKWLAAAVATAVAIAFVGCGDGAGGRNNDDDDNVTAGVLGLEVTVINENWPGVDLVHQAHPGGEHDEPLFGFQAGDTISIAGRIIRNGGAYGIGLNLNQAGISWLGGWRSGATGEFSDTLTVTEEAIATIEASAHAHAIRIRGETAGHVFVIEGLTIRRGETVLFDLVEDILEDLAVGTTGASAIFGAGPVREFPIMSAGGANHVSFRVVGPGTLPALAAPTITTQPASRNIAMGATEIAPLTVVADEAPDNATRTYQWQVQAGEAWNDIADATTASLALAAQIGNAAATGTWNFRVVVSNARGDDTESVTSSAATVMVYDPTVTITIPALGLGADNAIDFTTLGSGPITLADFNAVTGIGVSGRNDDEADMVLTVSPAGLAVSGRSANHNAVKIDLAALGLDAATTYTVTVTGAWEPVAGEPIIGLVLGGDHGNPGSEHGADSFSNNETTFSVSVNVLGSVSDALVMTRGWGYNQTTDFTITNISVVELVEAPAITTATLPGGFVGTVYNQTLAATGSTPITWTLYSGSLPDGLTLSEAGVISGTPTLAGTFNFTVEATNPEGDDTQALTIEIATPMVIPTAPVPVPTNVLFATGGLSLDGATLTGRSANTQGIGFNFDDLLVGSYTGGLVTIDFTLNHVTALIVARVGIYNFSVGAIPGLDPWQINDPVLDGTTLHSLSFVLPGTITATQAMLSTNDFGAGVWPDITITSITLGPLPADD